MKHFNKCLFVFLAIISFNIKPLNAQNEFEKEDKILKYIVTISRTYDQHKLTYNSPISNLESPSVEESKLTNSSLTLRELNTITQTDSENEILLENWMFDINIDLWITDYEEALEIENWMFDHCNWLN
jgi:hypothetical protein